MPISFRVQASSPPGPPPTWQTGRSGSPTLQTCPKHLVGSGEEEGEADSGPGGQRLAAGSWSEGVN